MCVVAETREEYKMTIRHANRFFHGFKIGFDVWAHVKRKASVHFFGTNLVGITRSKEGWNILLLFLQHSRYSLVLINWKINARYESFSSCLISKEKKGEKEKRGKGKHGWEWGCKPLCVWLCNTFALTSLSLWKMWKRRKRKRAESVESRKARIFNLACKGTKFSNSLPWNDFLFRNSSSKGFYGRSSFKLCTSDLIQIFVPLWAIISPTW